jgi:hypothetical protein
MTERGNRTETRTINTQAAIDRVRRKPGFLLAGTSSELSEGAGVVTSSEVMN